MKEESDASKLNLFDYPFLFSKHARVTCFRAINHHSMKAFYERALVNARILNRATASDATTRRGEIRTFDHLASCLGGYLVLEIRRETLLTDAFNHLWRRKPTDLLKPLKVRMGREQGEEGLDQGGVSQEFFRLAMAEALDPNYGE